MTLPDSTTLIVLLSGLCAFVSVLAVGLQLLSRDQLNERLKMVAERRRELSARQKEVLQAKGSRFQLQRHIGLMKSVLDRLRLQNLLENKELRAKLAQAGWRRPSAVVAFVFARVALPLVLLGLTLLYFSANPYFAAWPWQQRFLAAFVGAIVGAGLPGVMLKNTIQKRQFALSRAFPDALDLMVICVEAGLSIEGAFQKVVEEMAASAPILAEEIALTGAELAFLSDRRQAYENLTDRTAGFGGLAGAVSRKPRSPHVGGGEKGGSPAGQANRADDPVLPAGAVYGDHRPGNDPGDDHHGEIRGKIASA